MTQLEKLSVVLADGCWHLTEELLQEVGYRFSANRHTAARNTTATLKSDVGAIGGTSIECYPS